ncbi:hypothetical protein EDB89DRAFT_1860912, partial [Lactarius sanguifluus]
FVHFACYGTLEAGKPLEAGFELHGGERVTLLEIVRSHLPTAEFAFLSACHIAEATEESIVDEVLHLAEGLLDENRGHRITKALRFAVKNLRRKKRITLERWVNFGHYGARPGSSVSIRVFEYSFRA